MTRTNIDGAVVVGSEVNGVNACKETVAYFECLIPGFDPKKTLLDFRNLYPNERGGALVRKPKKIRGALISRLDELLRDNDKRYGIFVTVNQTDGEGVKTENIVGIRAVWADWDHGRPVHIPLEPSFAIESSPGRYQAYWLLRDEMTKDQFGAVMAGIVKKYGGDNGCKDSARVLRVPGFYHTKGEPWLVRFEGGAPDRPVDYTAASLVAAFALPKEEKPRPLKSETRQVKKVASSIYLRTFEFDAAKVKEALDCLPDTVADDYATAAVSICAALKRGSGGSEEGRELWHEFAARSQKYTAEWADAKWDSYDAEDNGEDKISLGTLFHMAGEYGFKTSALDRAAALEEVQVEDEDENSKTASEYGLSVDTWTEDTTKEFFSRMNKEHALVTLGSSVRYLHERDDPNGARGAHFLQPDGMKRLYANVIVPVGERKLNGFDAWDRWKGRRQCRGVALFPGTMKVPIGYINLWRGFAVEPRQGRWNLFHDHLLKIVCSGNEDYYFWLMDWLAHIFQHPDEKPGSAVVLKSEAKGTGKSMIFQFLRRILGSSHAMSVAQANHVVGNFNGHLMQNILLGVEEAFWAGNKAAEGVIKNLITEPTITIEQKGIDPIGVPNYTRLLINSNESWTVPVGIDERRFFVLEVNNPRAKDRSYFDPIFQQMKEEGGIEAMLYELLNWKIEANLRNPPETKALVQEREFSLDGVHRWLCEVARSGFVYDKAHGSDLPLSSDGRTEIDRSVVREAARDYCTTWEVKSLDTRLGLLLRKVGVESSQPRRQGKRARVYAFPPLPALCEAVERVVRVSACEEEA